MNKIWRSSFIFELFFPTIAVSETRNLKIGCPVKTIFEESYITVASNIQEYGILQGFCNFCII